jgi:hypothetical protein
MASTHLYIYIDSATHWAVNAFHCDFVMIIRELVIFDLDCLCIISILKLKIILAFPKWYIVLLIWVSRDNNFYFTQNIYKK